MGTNYQRGVRVEYDTIYKLEKMGYTAIRTPGSHSPVDVWAFRDGHYVLPDPYDRFLIQCKSGSSRFTRDAASLLIGWAEAWKATPVLVQRKDGRTEVYEVSSGVMSQLELTRKGWAMFE